MPKPTLLQSLLGQPSQTYYHPPQRDYHSTKDELFRIANATKVLPGHLSCSESGFDSSTPANSDSEQPHLPTPPTSTSTLARPPAISAVLPDGASSELRSNGSQASLKSTSRRSAVVSSLSRTQAGCGLSSSSPTLPTPCGHPGVIAQAVSYPLHRVIFLFCIIQDGRYRPPSLSRSLNNPSALPSSYSHPLCYRRLFRELLCAAVTREHWQDPHSQ